MLVLSIRFTEEQQLEYLWNEKHADHAGLSMRETICNACLFILRAHVHVQQTAHQGATFVALAQVSQVEHLQLMWPCSKGLSAQARLIQDESQLKCSSPQELITMT